jgi:hypothetical protein
VSFSLNAAFLVDEFEGVGEGEYRLRVELGEGEELVGCEVDYFCVCGWEFV